MLLALTPIASFSAIHMGLASTSSFNALHNPIDTVLSARSLSVLQPTPILPSKSASFSLPITGATIAGVHALGLGLSLLAYKYKFRTTTPTPAILDHDVSAQEPQIQEPQDPSIIVPQEQTRQEQLRITPGYFQTAVDNAINRIPTSVYTQRYITLQQETEHAKRMIDQFKAENRTLTQEVRTEILIALTNLWNEANFLIHQHSFFYYFYPDNDDLRNLKNQKATIAELIELVSDQDITTRIKNLSWKATSLIERKAKLGTVVTAAYLAHRTGAMYTAMHNIYRTMFKPKKALELLKYLVLPQQLQPKTTTKT